MKTVTYTHYFSPGTFVSNTHEVPGLPQKWPDNAFARQVWAYGEVEIDGITYKSEPQKVGKLVYHPSSRITTLAELEGGRTEFSVGSVLLANMRNNGWDAVIWSRWKNWPQLWDPDTMEIEREIQRL